MNDPIESLQNIYEKTEDDKKYLLLVIREAIRLCNDGATDCPAIANFLTISLGSME